jgi:limonene-1,2-epoxide hydrolase
MTHPIKIDGSESILIPNSPLAALSAFYAAFNERDLAAMEQNWLTTTSASMSNPVGGIKRGWDEIKTVYEKIFSGPATVYVCYHDFTIHESGDMFQAVGRERGSFKLPDTEINLAIRTSRTFIRVAGDWRQLHHHGSIDSPKLLERYQVAVLGEAIPTPN